jgi:protein TonB
VSTTPTIADFDLGSHSMALNARSRLKVAVLVSVVLHAVVLFGISFKLPVSGIITAAPLEVVLVSKPVTEPKKEETARTALALDVPTPKSDIDSKSRANHLSPATPQRTATDTPASTASTIAPDAAPAPDIASNTPDMEEPEGEPRQPLTALDSHSDQSAYQAESAFAQPQQGQNSIFNTADLVQRGLAIARVTAQQGGDFDTYQKPVRRRFVGTRTKDYRFARYAEDWRLKVERIGNLNYPETAKREQLYGSLQLTVGIKSDGSLESVEINRPSGKKVLDEAAVRIVKLAGQNGFAPFPPDMSRDIDVLHITRNWVFTRADQLISE